MIRHCLPLFAVTACVWADLPADAKSAAERSVALIQKVNAQWKTPCVSCHHQVLGAMALEAARQHGIAVEETVARAATERDFKLLLDLDGAVRVDQLIDPAMSEGSMLLGAHAAGVRPSLVTAVYARHIARNQRPDGHWFTFDNRPPHSHSAITATAIGARAVALYHPSPGPVLARAARWLAAASADDTEEATFRLLGLLWCQAPPEALTRAGRELGGLQQADGGWRQWPGARGTDAYSTAQAVYALRASQAWRAQDESFARGVRWLVDRQAKDGSWHVPTRLHSKAPISPPYFESGFPYGHDQFVSMAATAWAVRALAEALPVMAKPAEPLAVPSFDESKVPWARAALFGSVADLAKIDANAATPEGTTALMMAADDAAKVEALLKRGARAKAVAKSGYDALTMASLFHGNTRTAELLLKAGAPLSPRRKVRFDMSPLAAAVMTNDPELVALYLAKGADANRGFRLLGGSEANPPAFLAAGFGNNEILRLLVKAGARMDYTDSMGMSLLSWAALSVHPDTVRTLLDLGAKREHKDKAGLTPLDHHGTIEGLPAASAALLR